MITEFVDGSKAIEARTMGGGTPVTLDVMFVQAPFR
jgi:hypothetical protein